jgi:hypothetical protein
MNELSRISDLTIDEHIERIQRCLQRTRDSIFETVVTIKECKEQLGDDVFQNEVSERLGMSPSTLNRWLSIGNCEFIMNNKDNVPSTFSGLYSISRLEKKYTTFYPKDSDSRLQKLIDEDSIQLSSQNNDILELEQRIDSLIKRRNKKIREKKMVGLNSGVYQSQTKQTTLDELVTNRELFRTFVINLNSNQITKWGDDSIFEMDIRDEFPLHEIRSPNLTDLVVCLIRVPMKKINVGLKVMKSFGFTYRDTFVPQDNVSGLRNVKDEIVIIRGERGTNKSELGTTIKSSKITDVLEYCEDNFREPMLVVFDDVERTNWVSIND